MRINRGESENMKNIMIFPAQMGRICQIFQFADKWQGDYIIANYDKNCISETVLNALGGDY